jgi:hypothetical protein
MAQAALIFSMGGALLANIVGGFTHHTGARLLVTTGGNA